MNLDEARKLARILNHLDHNAPHVSPSYLKIRVGVLERAASTINELAARLEEEEEEVA